MKKCIKCGFEVEDDSLFCHNCGYRMEEFNNNNVNTNIKTSNSKTSGLSIAGFVISMICTLFGASIFLQLSTGVDKLNQMLLDYSTEGEQIGVVVGFIIGFTAFNFVPGIVGTILSGIGMTKKKDAISIIGLILNIMSVLVCIFASFYIIMNV